MGKRDQSKWRQHSSTGDVIAGIERERREGSQGKMDSDDFRTRGRRKKRKTSENKK